MVEFIIKESIIGEIIDLGEKEELFKISGKKIEYLPAKKSYNIADPEEQVRASFYYELTKNINIQKKGLILKSSYLVESLQIRPIS